MKAIASLSLAIVVFFTGCAGGAQEYSSVDALAAALGDEGIRCGSVEETTAGDLVADQGSCDGHDLFVFDGEQDRDRWLEVGAALGEVVVGPNWAIVPNGSAQDIADALGGDVR